MSTGHLEHITRAAARALGHQAAAWQWDGEQCSLVGTVGLHDQPHSFGPLIDPADAFTLEALLRLDVTYETDGKHTRIVVRRASMAESPRYMDLMPTNATASVEMRERMRAVTQFAAILDQLGIAED